MSSISAVPAPVEIAPLWNEQGAAGNEVVWLCTPQHAWTAVELDHRHPCDVTVALVPSSRSASAEPLRPDFEAVTGPQTLVVTLRSP